MNDELLTIEAPPAPGSRDPAWSPELAFSVEQASPGQRKSLGKGVTLRTGYAETPFGRALLAQSPRGLCHLAFLNPWGETEARNDLVARWPAAKLIRDGDAAVILAKDIFHPAGKHTKPLHLHLAGSAFQLAVWQALLAIPVGTVSIYSQIATATGNPNAHRATGTAIGMNPVAWLIPCHRVIRRDGATGNYRWGRERKLAMLKHEGVRGI
ncbi:MAG: methylated-DNA--[protein]-cysteine S-methyltransferase [Verrucomicrobiales bacterium]